MKNFIEVEEVCHITNFKHETRTEYEKISFPVHLIAFRNHEIIFGDKRYHVKETYDEIKALIEKAQGE